MEDYSEKESTIPLNRTGKVHLTQANGHLYSGSQSLLYRARLEDHGTNLTCTVLQLDHLGSVLYSSTISLQLEVAELVPFSQPGVLEERIGIISAIILAIIFIILVFILVTKRRRKVVKYAAVA